MLRIRSRRRSQGRQKTGSHSEGQPACSRVQAAWVIKGVQSRAHKSLAPSVRCLGEGWEAVQGIFRNTGGSTLDPGKRVSCGRSLIKLRSRVRAYHRVRDQGHPLLTSSLSLLARSHTLLPTITPTFTPTAWFPVPPCLPPSPCAPHPDPQPGPGSQHTLSPPAQSPPFLLFPAPIPV